MPLGLDSKVPFVDSGARQFYGVVELNASLPQATAILSRVTGERPDRCDPAPAAKTTFSGTDPHAYQFTSATGVVAGDVVRWEWIRPDGSVFVARQLTLTLNGNVCFWDGLLIADQAPARIPGDWQVRMLYNGTLLATNRFTITNPAPGAGRLCAREIQSFYVGVLSLGFAAVRASCSFGLPIPPAAVDLMRADLNQTVIGVNAMAPCIRFDTSRLTSLSARLADMTGDVALAELEQIYTELRQAVRSADLRCDQSLDASAMESFYLATLNLGFAAARATCFPCQETIPPEQTTLIQTDLANAQNALRPYAACIPSFDFGLFGTVRLGPPFQMIETYNDLGALYNAVLLAIANSSCCCSCTGTGGGGGGSTGGTQTGTCAGHVRNASNGQPISGATVSVAGTNLSGTTAADGAYSIANVPAGQRTLNASASGFLATQINVNVVGGQTLTQNFSLSPTLQTGETRITLNWNKNASNRPDDLDMHMTGPNPDGTSCFRVYYSARGSLTNAPFVQLEVDNINVTGHPPTETIRIARLTPGIYRFYVHDYSGELPDGIFQSRATAQVFGSGGLTFSQTAPAGSVRYWNVFTMNGSTGAITQVNQMVSSAPAGEPCR